MGGCASFAFDAFAITQLRLCNWNSPTTASRSAYPRGSSTFWKIEFPTASDLGFGLLLIQSWNTLVFRITVDCFCQDAKWFAWLLLFTRPCSSCWISLITESTDGTDNWGSSCRVTPRDSQSLAFLWITFQEKVSFPSQCYFIPAKELLFPGGSWASISSVLCRPA